MTNDEYSMIKLRYRHTDSCRLTTQLIALILPLLLLHPCAFADQQHVIVAVGAHGTPKYGQDFNQWAYQWEAAAAAGGAAFEIVGRGAGGDDLKQLQRLVAGAIQESSDEPLWLILIGHGTFDGRTPRFNLRGRDLSAEATAEMLAPSQRPIAVINCSSCSAPFVNALSAPNRIVMTGTKDGSEIQFTRFGGFLADAIGRLDADIDRDGQTSLLEAWLYASQRTEEFYKSDGRLATEHSLLDDTGDSKGTRSEVYEGVRIKDNVKNRGALDGSLARRWHLVRSESERSLTSEQRRVRDELEERLEKLRQSRSDFSEEDYLRKLEEVLIPLAQLYERAASITDKDTRE